MAGREKGDKGNASVSQTFKLVHLLLIHTDSVICYKYYILMSLSTTDENG